MGVDRDTVKRGHDPGRCATSGVLSVCLLVRFCVALGDGGDGSTLNIRLAKPKC